MALRPAGLFPLLIALGLGVVDVAPQRKAGHETAYSEIERRIENSDFSVADRQLMQLAIEDPRDIKTLELLARLRFRQGRLDESRALYQRVLGLEPTNPAAGINSARIAFVAGHADEARRLLNAVDDGPKLLPTLRLELAAAYLLIGDAERSLKNAEALPAGIRSMSALPLFGEIYLRLNRLEAIKSLVPSMRTAAAQNSSLAVQCADVLRGAGMFKDAIGLLSAVPVTRRDGKVLINLSRLEVITGDLVRAKQHLQAASKLDPLSPELLSLQAYFESASGNNAAALKTITKAREVAPNSPAILADFVALTLRLGKPVLAFEAARTLTGIVPGDIEYQYLLGVASLQSGNLDPAEATLGSYVQVRPNDFRGCLALGMVFAAQNGRSAKAQEQLAKCNEMDPTNSEARYQLALSFKSQGENAKAISLLEQVIERAPDKAFAFRDLGALYLESGDDQKARNSLEKAATLAPKDGDTHFQLARLYNRIGEMALARKHQEIFQSIRGVWGKGAQ
ncbi:MAG: tetratricopeptide repeat protein [Pyrinomonadaceae bacterium]